MKKLTLLAGTVALAFGSLQAQVPMIPLVEHFTQASCPPCASQNPTLYSTLNTFANGGGKYVKITYQTSWPGTDPMNAAYPAGPAARVTRHGVSGVPNVSMNGGAAGGPNSIVTASSLSTAAARTSDFQIDMSHQYLTGRDVEVTVKVKNMGTTNQAAGKQLFVAMTEREIRYTTPPGSNGETEFFYVVRNMYNPTTGASSTSGGALPAINMGDSASYTFTVTIPTYVRSIGEVGFAAFMEDPSNSNAILQSGYSAPVVPATALDVATANGVFGSGQAGYCSPNMTPQFTITNTTANPITSVAGSYTINGGTPVTTTVSGLNLAQGQSANVVFPAIVLARGTNNITYNIDGLNGSNPDFSSANNQGMTGSVVIASLASVGSTISSDFQSMAIGAGAPTNSISINPNSIRAYKVDSTISNAITWSLGGFGNSNGCYRWDFWSINNGLSSTVLYEKIDMTANTNANGAKLKWARAHAPYSASSTDRMRVKISTDCGATWTTPYDKAGSTLSTTGIVSGARFYPQANQWAWDSVNLDSYINETELMIAFEGVSNFGNSLYIDDINIEFAYPVNVDKVNGSAMDLTLFPNPVQNVLNVSFAAANATDLTLTITNALGQKVQQVANGTFVGEQNIRVNTSELIPGVYFINAVSDAGVTTKRFVVER